MCTGSDKILRSVSFKFLVEIGKARSISCDDACFQLSGGQLSYNTLPVYKCSVSSFDLDDLTDGSDSRHDTFKWHNIVRKYKERPDALFPLSSFFRRVTLSERMVLVLKLCPNSSVMSLRCCGRFRMNTQNGS
jgi:hypothetical protein